MRMGFGARQAKDLLNHAAEADIADILYRYGGENAHAFWPDKLLKNTKRLLKQPLIYLIYFLQKFLNPKGESDTSCNTHFSSFTHLDQRRAERNRNSTPTSVKST